MVCVSKTWLVAHVFFSCAVDVWASRRKGDAADDVRELFSDKNNQICGGSKIRRWLTDDVSLSSIRTPKWDKVEAIADQYLVEVANEIKVLQEQEALLERQLEDAKKGEVARDLTGEEIQSLIESALKDFFTDPATAAAVKCGFADRDTRKKYGVKAGAYRKTEAVFKELVKEKFKGGKVRVTGDAFNDKCLEVLGAKAEDPDDLCDDFCAELSQDASEESINQAGVYAGPGSQALSKQLDEVKDKLQQALVEQAECERAKSSLEAFLTEIKELNEDIKEKVRLRLEAKERLDEALDELDEMNDVKGDLEGIASKCEEELQLSSDRVQRTSELLKQAQEAEKASKELANQAKHDLDEVEQLLSEAIKASTVVLEIKGLVVQTMAAMWNLYEAAVVKPIRSLDLMAEYFQASSVDTSEKEAVGQNLVQLDSYCSNTATKAFEAVKDHVDLSPLCALQKEEIATEIYTTVATRREEVKALLDQVQERLNPFKGQDGMSEDKALELESQGEPKGLRKILTVFGNSPYYVNYLDHWRVNAAPPKFLDLLAAMTTKVEQLTQKQAAAQKAKEELMQHKDEEIQKRKAVRAELDEAVKNNEVNKENLDKALAELNAQNEVISKMENDVSALEAALAAATKALKDAKDKLQDTHKRGTDLLELFGRTEVLRKRKNVALAHSRRS